MATLEDLNEAAPKFIVTHPKSALVNKYQRLFEMKGDTLHYGSGSRRRKDSFINKGTVTFCNDQKGFGFIQPDDGGKDVFVHARHRRDPIVLPRRTALERAGMRGLVEGQKVSFDTQEDRRTGKIQSATSGLHNGHAVLMRYLEEA
jgi:CspA family cold shock protein